MQPITFPDVGRPLRAADGFRYDATATAPARSQVRSLEQLVEQAVQSGDAIHFPWLSTRAYGALFEVIRQARSGRLCGLTVISASLRAEVGLLVASGGVDKLVTSFAATTYPSVRPNSILAQAVKDGTLVVEEWSILALIQRVLAGALGWPFVPAGTMDDTDLPAGAGPGVRSLVDPFDGSERSVMPALRPDVSLIHCPVADWEGNGVLFPPFAEDVHTVYAARRGVILTADHIVSPADLRRWAGNVRVPAARVLGVAHVPLGAHPSASPVPVRVEGASGYGEDYEFLAELGRLRTVEDAESFSRKWIDVSTRQGYLSQLGRERIEHLVAMDLDESWRIDEIDTEPDSADVGEVTLEERLAVSGARAMEKVARASGTRTVVAGAGLSHLAAALGRTLLLENQHVVDLVFESGVLGYVPRPHDATLSNTRNLPTARHLSSTLEVLGMLLPSTPDTTIAVLSAGVIDSQGNANSNRSPSGHFLVGGGGSTDIAARVTTIAVVAADPRKFVETAKFISYCGTNLEVIATDIGHLRRQDGVYVLSAWFADVSESADGALAQIRSATGWDVQLAPDVHPLDAPSATELEYLRAIDPDGNLLG
ncbi:CoA-transferase [Rhodococcus sp. OK302]|uniref:CoA-transferase n=1 Tax=Rhodococcus sp. OK302 TaxID=1882769 RepID=UPI000B9F2EA0|nr:CoA-transferase [Rhodococcus sp. OK302]OYD61446.1 acyl CoA:acetate/3-ketoacid CoA transferase alpha subunit [Rhodococcus sp. OK302]